MLQRFHLCIARCLPLTLGIVLQGSSAFAVGYDDVPTLTVCEAAATPFDVHVEDEPAPIQDTVYYSCVTACPGPWNGCVEETTARGVAQKQLYFVVDEDGAGRGLAGTLRFTASGASGDLVFFHRGGAGTDWDLDYLPGKVEDEGGIAAMVKWESGHENYGWLTRPTSFSNLEPGYKGVSQRPAAVIKWYYENVASALIGTVGCSYGSVATYTSRLWHDLDGVLRYQLLMGGPVLYDINDGCGGGNPAHVGRCSKDPTQECNANNDCAGLSNKCVEYEWQNDIIMTLVRKTVDHIHSVETGGATDCEDKQYNSSFEDSSLGSGDLTPTHRIDFVENQDLGLLMGDDDLNVMSGGAAVYSDMPSNKRSWTVSDGEHCDSLAYSSTVVEAQERDGLVKPRASR